MNKIEVVTVLTALLLAGSYLVGRAVTQPYRIVEKRIWDALIGLVILTAVVWQVFGSFGIQYFLN